MESQSSPMTDARPEQRVPVLLTENRILLPGVPMSYLVFNPRSRVMVDDLMKRPPEARWLAVARAKPEGEVPRDFLSAVYPVATVGRITHYEQWSEEGDHHIVLDESRRALLREYDRGERYDHVHVTWLPDQPADPSEVAEVLDQLGQAVLYVASRLDLDGRDLVSVVAGRDRPDLLSYRLATVTTRTTDRLYGLLAETDPVRRLRWALDVMIGLLGVVSRRTVEDSLPV